MLQPLKQTDYSAVKQLFQDIFDQTEDTLFKQAWKNRTQSMSLGVWEQGLLVGAIIVQPEQTGCIQRIEYLFVHESYRTHGVGGLLLKTVLKNCCTIHLTAVEDLIVRAWYKKHGFHQTSENIFVRLSYTLRSKRI